MLEKDIVRALSALAPERAIEVLREALGSVLHGLEDEEKEKLILSLFGPAGHDEVSSMVHY
ncbi:MAG: hypothetical protein KQJ78_23325 [Deltaproteobacteria bacterium]|nr:hypothetical protein [Deltaproteobacteria bacterium]